MSLIEEESREIQKYLDSIYLVSHSSHTVNSYRSGLNQFSKFVDENYDYSMAGIISKIKDGKLDAYKILNEFSIFLDKNGKRSATIKLWLTVAKGYLRHHSIKIYSEDFRQFVKIPKEINTRKEPLTKEIIQRVLRNVPPKLQTIILVVLSSGMRIGEIVQIKLYDVDFNSKPTRIRIRAEISKNREERETFLTDEATRSLKDYLQRYFGWKDDQKNTELQEIIIFGRTKVRKQDSELKGYLPIVTENVLITSMKRHLQKIPELSKRNGNGRMVIHFHAFREFFYTTLSNVVGSNYAHALMGHHEYLDTYYVLPDEKKRELYLKAEPHLTISDFSKIERDLISVGERQKEIEENHIELLQMLKSEHVAFPKALEKYVKI